MPAKNVALDKMDAFTSPTSPTALTPPDKDELRLLLLGTLDRLLRRNHEIAIILSDFRATLTTTVEPTALTPEKISFTAVDRAPHWHALVQDEENDFRTTLLNLQNCLLRYDDQIQKAIYDVWGLLKADPKQRHRDAQRPGMVTEQVFTPDKYTKKHLRYRQLISRIQELVGVILPPIATVLVVSKGDDELLTLNGRRGWHFPQNREGVYAGYYPKDSHSAVDHLEALRIRGGEFLLLPNTSFWWLDYYADFFRYLDSHYPRIWNDDACIIYQLEHYDQAMA